MGSPMIRASSANRIREATMYKAASDVIMYKGNATLLNKSSHFFLKDFICRHPIEVKSSELMKLARVHLPILVCPFVINVMKKVIYLAY